MSDPEENQPDPADEQGVAESIDEETIDDLEYPPERPMGVGHLGETAAEGAGGESVAERARAEEPEVWQRPVRSDVPAGLLVDENAGDGPDEEAELVGREVPSEEPMSAEEAAVRIEEP